MSDPKNVSLDDVLAEQEKFTLLATVEAVPERADQVKITPWAKTKGCSCDTAVTVHRKLVAGIQVTDEVHFCCGKKLKVVEISFNDSEDIDIASVFESLSVAVNKAATASRQASSMLPSPYMSPATAHSPYGPPANPNFWNYFRNFFCTLDQNTCLQGCWDSENPEECECQCRNAWCNCTQTCKPIQCPQALNT